MKKIDLNALDALFGYLNKPNNVFWMRDKTYKKQLYISPSFERIWETSCTSMYEDKEAVLIKSTLLPNEDSSRDWIELDCVKEDIGAGQAEEPAMPLENGELLIKIKTPRGTQRFIQDSHFLLVDQDGNHLGFAGVAEELTQEEWYAKYYAKKSELIKPGDDLFKKHLFDLLKKEAGISSNLNKVENVIPLYAFRQQRNELVFTQRESECIHYLRQGNSAKQTGALLFISARTVEFHLNNARIKAQCRSKLELLAKVFIKK